jgi:hypothetical protein
MWLDAQPGHPIGRWRFNWHEPLAPSFGKSAESVFDPFGVVPIRIVETSEFSDGSVQTKRLAAIGVVRCHYIDFN